MNAIRTLAFRWLIKGNTPTPTHYEFKSDTLAALEAAADDALDAAMSLAAAARYADKISSDASCSLRIAAVRRMETQLALLDEARRRAAELVKAARIDLGR